MAQDVTIEVLEVSVTISPEEQARTFALQAEAAKTGAETAESGAVTAKNQSETARDQAVTAKNAAETAETGAETARDKAEEWAESATPPEAGSKSSKTWAGESANSASEAATSAIDAGNEKDAAEGFKNLSQAWAESATAPDGVGTKSSKTYASESEAARDASVVAQGQSETAKDAAVVAQGNAETARDQAVTAKNAAELAETGAETAESNAVTAKNQSETARDLSQAWAESATEPGGVGTKSSKTWAGEAEQSATDAEAAKDAVEAITDFTDGNFYRGDGTGIEAVNEFLVVPSIAQYGTGNLNNIPFADNFFSRGNDPATDVKGNTYTNKTIGIGVYKTLDTSGADSTERNNFRIFISYVSRVASNEMGFLLYRDDDNFYEFIFTSNRSLKVNKTVAGVTTEILSTGGGGGSDGPERFVFNLEIWFDNRGRRIYIPLPDGTLFFDNGATLFPDSGSLNLIGFKNQTPAGNFARILNYRVEQK